MEYAAGGNLYQLVARSGGLPEPDARWYFQQLIFAIDYCHKMVRGGTSSCMHATGPLLGALLLLQQREVCCMRCVFTSHGSPGRQQVSWGFSY